MEKTHKRGVLLFATGPNMRELTQRGVAHASTPSEGNVKEATTARLPDGRWRLFYEYTFQQASLSGLAFGEDIQGPWRTADQPFGPRPGADPPELIRRTARQVNWRVPCYPVARRCRKQSATNRHER